jgi:hypothetical protein
MMERASILPGKCYLDSRGVVYEVTSCDGQNVQFLVRAEPGAASGRHGSEPWETFLQKLQGEVLCPE